jgi:hypothetical protein
MIVPFTERRQGWQKVFAKNDGLSIFCPLLSFQRKKIVSKKGL